jgi:hypothetical protein
VRTSAASRSNSRGASATGAPARRTSRRARSISSAPARTGAGPAAGARGAPQQRLDARQQLHEAERLGDVVVGAEAEAR